MEFFKMFNEAGATLGRIIQQAEEVFLAVSRTEYSEEYKNNIKKVDFLIVLTQKAIADAEAFLEPSSLYNLEGKTIDTVLEATEKRTPLEDFGRALQATFPTTKVFSNPLDQDLFKVGKYQKRLGLALKSFHIKAIENYVIKLRKMLDYDLKKFKDEEAALELLRLDHDYMKNRMDNAYTTAGREAMEREYEKLKPVFDHQYEQTKVHFRTVNNYFNMHRTLLKDLVTIQRDYYRDCDKNLTRLLRKIGSDSHKVTYSLPIDNYPDGFISSSDVDEIIMRRKSAGPPQNGGLTVNLQYKDKVLPKKAERDYDDENSLTPINLTTERSIQEPIFEASENEGNMTPSDKSNSVVLNSRDISEAHPVRTIPERENESFFPELANSDMTAPHVKLNGSIAAHDDITPGSLDMGIRGNADGNLDTRDGADLSLGGGMNLSLDTGIVIKGEEGAMSLDGSVCQPAENIPDLTAGADLSLGGGVNLNLDTGTVIKGDEGNMSLDGSVHHPSESIPDLSARADMSLGGGVNLNLDTGTVIKGDEGAMSLDGSVHHPSESIPDLSVDLPKEDVKIDTTMEHPGSVDISAPTLEVHADLPTIEASNSLDISAPTLEAHADLPTIEASSSLDISAPTLEAHADLPTIEASMPSIGGDRKIDIDKEEHDLTERIAANINADLPHVELKGDSHLAGDVDIGLHSADTPSVELGSDIKLDSKISGTFDEPVSLGSIHVKESEPIVIEPTSDKVDIESHLETPDISLSGSLGGTDLKIGSEDSAKIDPGSITLGASGGVEANVDIEPPSAHVTEKSDDQEKKNESFSLSAGIHDSAGHKGNVGFNLEAGFQLGNKDEDIPPKPEGHYKFGFRNPKFDYTHQE